MNLLVSYQWLKDYLDLKETTPEQFAAAVSLSGPGIERLYPQGKELNRIVFGQITDINPHPNADKLRIAEVDIGQSSINIVCGGKNIAVGQLVAVALIGASVRWHGQGEPIVLKKMSIRGVESDGMICAADEIGLEKLFPHAEGEILDLGKELGWNHKPSKKLGASLADVLDLANDVVMDIEVTTNRPDAFSFVGLAREGSAILKKKFLWKTALKIQTNNLPQLDVTNKAMKLCPRYQAIKINHVHVAPSPWWLRQRLLSAKIHPINNLVDITNYVMLELGQPMHVFDAEKIENGIVIRTAREGETLEILDGKRYELSPSVLVIADAKTPIAIAGIMGGKFSGIMDQTTSVVFEAATFDPSAIRRTARDLNLYSDSQLRFEKGLSTEAPEFAMRRAAELCLSLAGGEIASELTDIVHKKKYQPQTYFLKITEVERCLGIHLASSVIQSILRRLGFVPVSKSGGFCVSVPWWRDHDIESDRDLVEEVARIHGYGNIPAVFPIGESHERVHEEIVYEDRARQLAHAAGLTEIYTYSFVSSSLMEKIGYHSSRMLRLQNPLSKDFEFMRTSLLPSMVQVVQENQERERVQRLFEIAHVYYLPQEEWTELPDEQLQMAAVFFGQDMTWKQAKGFVEHLLEQFGIKELTWEPCQDDPLRHPGRSADVSYHGKTIGIMGELHPRIAKSFGIEGKLTLVSLQLETIFAVANLTKPYTPIPAFPDAKRDLAIVVDEDISVQDVQHSVCGLSPLLYHLEWFDTYHGQGVAPNKKSLAFHLTFRAADHTLESHEVDAAMTEVTKKLAKDFQAILRT